MIIRHTLHEKIFSWATDKVIKLTIKNVSHELFTACKDPQEMVDLKQEIQRQEELGFDFGG